MKACSLVLDNGVCLFDELTAGSLGYFQELDFCETKEELVSRIERDKAIYPEEYNTDVVTNIENLLQKFVKGTSFGYVGSIDQYFVIIVLTDVTLFCPSGRVTFEQIKQLAEKYGTDIKEEGNKLFSKYFEAENIGDFCKVTFVTDDTGWDNDVKKYNGPLYMFMSQLFVEVCLMTG